jgi:methylaspartate mutase sigma subunit
VVVSGLSSDAHTWNLVFLQLLIEELGYRVVNLGSCVPDDVLLGECRRLAPTMVVIGSVNGHGHRDGLRVIEKLRGSELLAATPIVIGGKLGISGSDDVRHASELMAAGFDAIFTDGATAIADFRRLLLALPAPSAALESAEAAV